MTADWLRPRTTAFWISGGIPVPLYLTEENGQVSFPAGGESGEESVKCLLCGNVVTLRKGDAAIPYGDARLCEHMGQKPPYHPTEKQ